MYDLSSHILRINCLNHNDLSEYLKDMLLSIIPCNITYTVFFKKLYVILLHSPVFLKTDIKINKSQEHFVNFWSDFSDNQYFYDTRRFIRIKCLNLSNGYIVSIPVKIIQM